MKGQKKMLPSLPGRGRDTTFTAIVLCHCGVTLVVVIILCVCACGCDGLAASLLLRSDRGAAGGQAGGRWHAAARAARDRGLRGAVQRDGPRVGRGDKRRAPRVRPFTPLSSS